MATFEEELNLEAYAQLESSLEQQSVEDLEAFKKILEKRSEKENLAECAYTSELLLLDVWVCLSYVLKSKKREGRP